MSKPLLSIIIPVLNEEKILEDVLCLYTPELRTRYNLELVVSDGGSKDTSVDIARRHANTVVVHNGNERQTIAGGRNKGAEAAHGDVLIFINGDTVPDDMDRFFTVVTEFARRQGPYARASALACAVDFPKAERTFSDRLFHGFYNNYVRFLNTLRIGAGRGECQIVRADVFRSVGGYRSSLAAGEDFDLFARIGVRARVQFSWECMVIESPRRFRKFGYFRVIFWWTVNALSVMVRGRSSSDVWEPVR